MMLIVRGETIYVNNFAYIVSPLTKKYDNLKFSDNYLDFLMVFFIASNFVFIKSLTIANCLTWFCN